MKKTLAILALIAACGALCAPVWPRSGADEKVPAQSTITESFHPTAAVSETLPRKENKDPVDGQGNAACTVTEQPATVTKIARKRSPLNHRKKRRRPRRNQQKRRLQANRQTAQRKPAHMFPASDGWRATVKTPPSATRTSTKTGTKSAAWVKQKKTGTPL